jgi:hypothetical protein
MEQQASVLHIHLVLEALSFSTVIAGKPVHPVFVAFILLQPVCFRLSTEGQYFTQEPST